MIPEAQRPSRFAHHEELAALAEVLGEYGRMLQVVPEFYNTDITLARVDQLAELSLAHGIPTTFSPLFSQEAYPLGRVTFSAAPAQATATSRTAAASKTMRFISRSFPWLTFRCTR